MDRSEYLADPCRASSLPYWKTEGLRVPAHLQILREDEFSPDSYRGREETYFKLIHQLEHIPSVRLPAQIEAVSCGIPDFAAHINQCYTEEGVSPEELCAYQRRQVYDPDLWLALADTRTGRIVATGIAEFDRTLGEGILEWIQVSAAYRRQGLGSWLVCELLRRMQGRARFVTVSGRLHSESCPLALYEACGFTHPVIWHVISSEKEGQK